MCTGFEGTRNQLSISSCGHHDPLQNPPGGQPSEPSPAQELSSGTALAPQWGKLPSLCCAIFVVFCDLIPICHSFTDSQASPSELNWMDCVPAPAPGPHAHPPAARTMGHHPKPPQSPQPTKRPMSEACHCHPLARASAWSFPVFVIYFLRARSTLLRWQSPSTAPGGSSASLPINPSVLGSTPDGARAWGDATGIATFLGPLLGLFWAIASLGVCAVIPVTGRTGQGRVRRRSLEKKYIDIYGLARGSMMAARLLS